MSEVVTSAAMRKAYSFLQKATPCGFCRYLITAGLKEHLAYLDAKSGSERAIPDTFKQNGSGKLEGPISHTAIIEAWKAATKKPITYKFTLPYSHFDSPREEEAPIQEPQPERRLRLIYTPDEIFEHKPAHLPPDTNLSCENVKEPEYPRSAWPLVGYYKHHGIPHARTTYEETYQVPEETVGGYADRSEWVQVGKNVHGVMLKRHILREARRVCPECSSLSGFDLTLEETTSYFKKHVDGAICVRCGLVLDEHVERVEVLEDCAPPTTCKEKVIDLFFSGPQLEAVKGEIKVIESMPAKDIAKILREDLRNVKYALAQCEVDGICELFYKDIKNVKHMWVKSPYWQIEKKKKIAENDIK